MKWTGEDGLYRAGDADYCLSVDREDKGWSFYVWVRCATLRLEVSVRDGGGLHTMREAKLAAEAWHDALRKMLPAGGRK
jgi:hypothetical protein